METEYAYCTVWKEPLDIIQTNINILRVNLGRACPSQKLKYFT
jgi:hypothetical protein